MERAESWSQRFGLKSRLGKLFSSSGPNSITDKMRTVNTTRWEKIKWVNGDRKALYKKQVLLQKCRGGRGCYGLERPPQEGFAQKPGEGWKGRRASESLKGMRVDGSEQRQECKRG